MHRAYALLNVKSVDAGRRTITGIATTPTPDRMGDVVEPLGVTFTNPLPLLLYHNSQKPVGQVKFQKPTKDGIAFEAHLPTIAEPGIVKDRIDEAWHSLKADPPLIGGVSIGFRSLEESYMPETQSYRFLQTEVLELSLVVIPANQDAKIETVKSLDVDQPAALGAPGRFIRKSAGAPAGSPPLRRDRPMKKSLSERIADLKAERKTISERMETLMQPVVDQTGDLTDEQKKEYDDLTLELKETDADLARFEALERASIMPKAKAVTGDTPDEADQSRGRRIQVKQVELPPGIEFTRAVICKAAARLFGVSPLEVAKARYPDYPRIVEHLKTAVTAMGPSDTPALVATPQTLVGEFLDYLRPMTIIGQFGSGSVPSLTRVPFNSRIQSQTSGGSANWVGQGKGKPVTRFTFDAATLTWSKIAAISVIEEELVRFSTPSAEGRVRDGLAKAVVERLDSDFIDPNKAVSANVSPASITHGLSALSHTGTDADAVRTDVRTALGAFITANANPTNLVWIMPNSLALSLTLMRNALGQREFPDITMKGGMFEGFPVITSQYCATVQGSPTSNIVVLVNAAEIFLADDGGVSVDMSNQATIEMSDDPENDTGTQVNMFQTNQIALRAERYINWARGRSSSVVWFDGVAWAPPTS
jgi:HK97 family phage major capsid protein